MYYSGININTRNNLLSKKITYKYVNWLEHNWHSFGEDETFRKFMRFFFKYANVILTTVCNMEEAYLLTSRATCNSSNCANYVIKIVTMRVLICSDMRARLSLFTPLVHSYYFNFFSVIEIIIIIIIIIKNHSTNNLLRLRQPTRYY